MWMTRSKRICTKILQLATRWKYHLSNWPLCRRELIPGHTGFFFCEWPCFYQRCCHCRLPPSPPFWSSCLFFQPDRGFCRWLSGFTTLAIFCNRCAQCWWVSNLSRQKETQTQTRVRKYCVVYRKSRRASNTIIISPVVYMSYCPFKVMIWGGFG